MARRFIHYEAAFEDYIRSRGWPYVAVNEERKALFSGGRVKSFDFLVYPTCSGPAWLVEVKGRKFPYEVRSGLRFWENWVTRDDLLNLSKWEQVFGPGFQAMLIFAYHLVGIRGLETLPSVHAFRNRNYAFLGVPAAQYQALARHRSEKWDTVALSIRRFREMARPIHAA